MEVRSNPYAVRFVLARPIEDEALVHPYFTFPAAVINFWLGRATFHAAAIVVGGDAIAVLGGPGGGKSSTALAANSAGLGVLTDDLLVVDGVQACAGPRALDLRAEAAARFGGRYLGTVGSRERWRVDLPPVPSVARLVGFVALEWGASGIEVERLGLSEAFSAVTRHCGLGDGIVPPGAMLEIAHLPVWTVQRPRDLGYVEQVVTVLVDLATSAR
ncbi:MAG: hypothetical protein ACYCXY_11780 [Acidimicrobiales bacterium]